MPSTTHGSTRLDYFLLASAARLDLWRELNAAAQTWAAGARSGNPRAGRAPVEAALAEVRPLEDFVISVTFVFRVLAIRFNWQTRAVRPWFAGHGRESSMSDDEARKQEQERGGDRE